MSNDQNPVSVQFARLCARADQRPADLAAEFLAALVSGKRPLAEASVFWLEFSGQFGRDAARDAVAVALTRPGGGRPPVAYVEARRALEIAMGSRDGGRPSGQNHGRERVWLAIYDWRRETAPRETLTAIARRVAGDPSGEGLALGRITKRLRELVDERNLARVHVAANPHLFDII
ncbi:MAG: hypothetical protein V4597_15150 [Pseudomonadota bacterium]